MAGLHCCVRDEEENKEKCLEKLNHHNPTMQRKLLLIFWCLYLYICSPQKMRSCCFIMCSFHLTYPDKLFVSPNITLLIKKNKIFFFLTYHEFQRQADQGWCSSSMLHARHSPQFQVYALSVGNGCLVPTLPLQSFAVPETYSLVNSSGRAAGSDIS